MNTSNKCFGKTSYTRDAILSRLAQNFNTVRVIAEHGTWVINWRF